MFHLSQLCTVHVHVLRFLELLFSVAVVKKGHYLFREKSERRRNFQIKVWFIINSQRLRQDLFARTQTR